MREISVSSAAQGFAACRPTRGQGVDAALGDFEDATEQFDSNHERTASTPCVQRFARHGSTVACSGRLVCRPRGSGPSPLLLPVHAAILLGFKRLPRMQVCPAHVPAPPSTPAERVLITLCVSLSQRSPSAPPPSPSLPLPLLPWAPPLAPPSPPSPPSLSPPLPHHPCRCCFRLSERRRLRHLARHADTSSWCSGPARAPLPELRRQRNLCAPGCCSLESAASTARTRVRYTAATISEPRARAECVICDAEVW